MHFGPIWRAMLRNKTGAILIALQMATINTATHFGLEREIGSLAPGRRADVILTSDLKTLPIEMVIARGQIVAENGACLVECSHYDWPAAARATVNMARDLDADDFTIAAPTGANAVTANVIGVVENQAPTKALQFELPVTEGRVQATGEVCQIALVERHRATGGVVNAFVSGFGYEGRMEMASTVAHDSHHMIVVGTSKADMALAANRLAVVVEGLALRQRDETRVRRGPAVTAAFKSHGGHFLSPDEIEAVGSGKRRETPPKDEKDLWGRP